MATFKPTPNTLIQFELDRVPTDSIIESEGTGTEDVGTAIKRRLKTVGQPKPAVHIKRHKVKGTGLLALLKGRQLTKIKGGIRTGNGGRQYYMLTFAFDDEQPARARRKELDAGGIKYLQGYLDKPWLNGQFSTFGNEPDTCSMLFTGEMDATAIADAITDEEAAGYGLTVYNPVPKQIEPNTENAG